MWGSSLGLIIFTSPLVVFLFPFSHPVCVIVLTPFTVVSFTSCFPDQSGPSP